MKDKKSRVFWADRLRVACAVAMLLFAMVGYAKPGPVVLLLLLASVLAFAAVELLLNRCPHCDHYLDRNRGKFCQYCGGCIREDKPDT